METFKFWTNSFCFRELAMFFFHLCNSNFRHHLTSSLNFFWHSPLPIASTLFRRGSRMYNVFKTALHWSWDTDLNRQMKWAVLQCSCTWPGRQWHGHLELALWCTRAAQHLNGKNDVVCFFSSTPIFLFIIAHSDLKHGKARLFSSESLA